MRAIQWLIINLTLLVLLFMFISLDEVWNYSCNIIDDSPATSADIRACVSSEMYEPFIWAIWPLQIMCIINMFISYYHERKNG